jgi:hypothetical protein
MGLPTGEQVKSGIGISIYVLARLALAVLGIGLHLWTIIIALVNSGFLAAGVTLIFPALSELYWGFEVWKASGTLFNPYDLSLAAYVALFVLSWAGLTMVKTASDS